MATFVQRSPFIKRCISSSLTLLFVGGFLTGAGTTVDNTEGGGGGRELFFVR